MRVLWYTNIPMPAMDRKFGRENHGSGWWMVALLEKLRARTDIQLGVVTACQLDHEERFTEEGVDYIMIPEQRIRPPQMRYRVSRGVEKDIRSCAATAEQWKPDIIHVHGTERFYGMMKVRGLVRAPLIISIQGLMRAYCKNWYFGDLSFWDVLRTYRLREVLYGGLFAGRRHHQYDSLREEEMIRHADGMLGRTDWDRSHTWCVHPQTPYYHAGEVLRPEFFDGHWDVSQATRHQIITTSRMAPYKGIEVILEAMVGLRKRYPDVRLRIVGSQFLSPTNGYARELRGRIARTGLSSCVELAGWVDNQPLVKMMERSHVFVCASFLENICNSLAEAQLVGMPCVASYVGGMTTTVEDKRTGLAFPPGDAPLLADRISRLFEDDTLATRLGQAGKQASALRHDPAQIVTDLVKTYRDVVAKKAATTSI